MSFDASSTDIVLLAWERALGFADGEVAKSRQRCVRIADDGGRVTFVRVFGHSMLVAPASIATLAASLTDAELADHARLLSLTRTAGGHGLGSASLYYSDDLELAQPSSEITISKEVAEAAFVETQCPPDDVNEVGLTGMESHFTLMEDGTAVGTAAFTEVQGILAHLGVLVSPPWRRQGVGRLVSTIAAHEALASGLTVQWRAEVNHVASNKLAHSLGLVWAGTQTSVQLR
ncbi:MAG: GNAT family N-acetyltransferase [Acidobacteria bacterium]|nr:GNAT family N-acetyltransferase [Acidobacteriota bacterium]